MQQEKERLIYKDGARKQFLPIILKVESWYVLPKLADWQWSIARLLEQLGDNEERKKGTHIPIIISNTIILLCMGYGIMYISLLYVCIWSFRVRFSDFKMANRVLQQSWDDGGDDDTTHFH